MNMNGANSTNYPHYNELHTMLQIRDGQDSNAADDEKTARHQRLQGELDRAREKQLELETAIIEEKSRNLNLETQIQHFLKYGSSGSSHSSRRTSGHLSPSSDSTDSKQKEPDKAVEAEPDPKAALMAMLAAKSGKAVPSKPSKPTPKISTDGAAFSVTRQRSGNPGSPTLTPSSPAMSVAVTPSPPADAALDKYRKMIKFKMPKHSILNRMRQDGIDRAIMEQFEENEVLPGGNSVAAPPSSSNEPKQSEQEQKDKEKESQSMEDGLGKYRKMKKLKMPSASIANRMRQDGVDKAVIARFEEKGEFVVSPSSTSKTPTLSKEDEKALSKYMKMQRMNMPKQSIINRMRQDQVSPELVGMLFPDAPEAMVTNKAKRKQLQKGKASKPELPPNLSPKPVISPKNKMRNLHWTKVNPFDVADTIWSKVDDSAMKLDVEDLESKFCWKQIESANKGKESIKNEKQKKNEIVRVLDTRRSYNIEIFLGRLKMDPWNLREAMLRMDESVLSLDTIHKLINFVPTTEEAQQLDGFENSGNSGKLGVAENFVKIVRTVDDNLVERLVLWEFKLEFDDLYSAEKSKLKWLRTGHDAIKRSKNLKMVFSLILSIGNYMNGSTPKGQAYGFKLASLSQLTRSRTVDNASTLMEYIYSFLSEHHDEDHKEALNFTKDLSSLDDACSVDVSVVRQNIAALKHKLNTIKKRMDRMGVDTQRIKGDRFLVVMSPFHEYAAIQIQKLQKLKTETFGKLQTLGLWLNEPKDANFKYLKTLNAFRLSFNQSVKTVHSRKLKMAEIEKRRKWAVNKKKKIKQKQKQKETETETVDDDQKEQMLSEQNRESVRLRRMKNLSVGHKDREQNISDVVIQSLVAGSSTNFIQRLQDRANYKLNVYDR